MNHTMPGLPVHHQLPEFTQTHVHRVNDAIQPSHLLSSPFPPALNPSQHQGLFQWVSSSHEVASIGVSASPSVLPMNTQDWSPLGWIGWISLQSKELYVSLLSHFSCVRLFATPWTAAHQASMTITNSQSLPKLMSIESVMSSNHLILCRPFSSCLQVSHHALSQWVSASHQVAKVLELQLQHQSFQWIFRTDFL